jgi:CRISPR type IV-associated protein Csf2
MKRYIEGIITTVTPMNVAEFGKDGAGKTKTMQILTQSGRTRIPFFPGNDLRGGMRRHLGENIMDRVKPVGLPLFHALTCGASDQVPSNGAESVTRLIEGRHDLYLGTFGGGPYIQRGGIQVRDIVPVNNATIQIGSVPESYADLTRCYDRLDENKNPIAQGAAPWIIQEFTRIKVDDLVSCRNMRAPDLIENYAQVALEYMNKVNENSSIRKEEKKAAEEAKEKKRAGEIVETINHEDRTIKVGMNNIIQKEGIIPGVPLYLRIDFDDYISDAQIFAIAQCLAETVNNPMGGLGQIGWGRVKADLELVNGDRTKLLVNSEGIYAANSALPGAEEYDEILNAYTIESLSKILLDNTPKAEPKAKAKKAEKV